MRWGFIFVVGYLIVVPLYRLQRIALENDAAGYSAVRRSSRLWTTLRTTVMLGSGSLVIALIAGILLAACALRLPHRLRMLTAIPILPIVVPALASTVGWIFLFSPRPGYLNALLRALPLIDERSGPVNIYSMPWIVVLTGFQLTAFIYLFTLTGLRNINYELLEAARVAGASELRAWFTVLLPLLRPVLLYGSSIALLIGLGQFTAPLLLGTTQGVRVVSTEVYLSIAQSPINYAAAAAWASPLIMIGLTVVVLQRVLLRSPLRYATHGGRAGRATTGRTRWAAVPIIGYGFVTVVLPLGALVVVALSPYWSGSIDVGSFGLGSVRTVWNNDVTRNSIVTSVLASLSAVAIALPVGFIASGVLMKRGTGRISSGLLEVIVNLPLGIPAVVFGAGFLFTYSQPPIILYGTTYVIIIVYVTLMTPFTTRMQLGARMTLGSTYEEAAQVCGAGPLRRNVQVVLPMLRGSIAGAAAMMFVLLSHEFAASLLVRSSQTQVMGTVLVDYWSNGTYPVVAVMALVMTVVTALGVILAVAMGGTSSLERI